MTCMWHAGQNAQTEINRASPAIVADGFEETQQRALLWAICTRRFAKENEAYGGKSQDEGHKTGRELARRAGEDRRAGRR